MTSEWSWIGKDLVGSGCDLIWRYCLGISLEGVRKTKKNSIGTAGRRGRESNPRPPDYDLRVLTTRPRWRGWSGYCRSSHYWAHKRMQVFMWSACNCWPIWTKNGNQKWNVLPTSVKLHNTKYDNSSSRSRAIAYGQTGGGGQQTDVVKLTGAFLQLLVANTPKLTQKNNCVKRINTLNGLHNW
jgi:hypothetical protein